MMPRSSTLEASFQALSLDGQEAFTDVEAPKRPVEVPKDPVLRTPGEKAVAQEPVGGARAMAEATRGMACLSLRPSAPCRRCALCGAEFALAKTLRLHQQRCGKET